MSRWQRAIQDTGALRSARRDVAVAALAGVVTYLLVPIIDAEADAVKEALIVALGAIGGLAAYVILSFALNWLLAPRRLLEGRVERLETKQPTARSSQTELQDQLRLGREMLAEIKLKVNTGLIPSLDQADQTRISEWTSAVGRALGERDPDQAQEFLELTAEPKGVFGGEYMTVMEQRLDKLAELLPTP